MTIVCATHFTESSAEALAVAVQLARKANQPLRLVNVMGGLELAPGILSSRSASAKAALQAQEAALRAEGLDVEAALLHGNVEHALSRYCEFVGARLLLIGESRHSVLPVLGGVADRLASVISTPLLVVHHRAPFERWASGNGFLNVLLAVDHTWRPELAHAWLTRLAGYGALDVLAAHVWSPDDERTRRSGAREEDLAALLKAESSAALVALPQNVLTRVRLVHGGPNVAEALVELAEAEHIDLIALGTNGPRGPLARLRSVTHDVLRRSTASTALVPNPPPYVAPARASRPSSPRAGARPHPSAP